MLPPIETRVAHVGHGELQFRGYRVFAELLGKTTTAQMLILGISGRLLDVEESHVVDDITTAMSSADPRMWPFKIVRLASAYGTASVGVAAGLLAATGGLFGPSRMRDAAAWLQSVHHKGDLDDDALLTELDHGTKAFGVLYRNKDERYAALLEQARQRKRRELPYTRLCDRIAELGRAHRQIEPHVFLGVAAVALDLGLSLDAIAGLATLLLFHDGLANAVEGAAQAPAVLRQFPLGSLAYRGPGHRTTPSASASLV
jgi:hypothetical protein